jgi:hypothetical protein
MNVTGGGVPIGTFWKDAASAYVQNWIEESTFNVNHVIFLTKGNVHSTSEIKVTSVDGATTYTQGTDYSVTLNNGVITNLMAGIAPHATVIIAYTYSIQPGHEFWNNGSTKWATGQTYDRLPDASIGSGKIAVIEGNVVLYTDQYDPVQTYTLNAALRSDANSLWTVASTGNVSSICGRVVKVPTATDPFLGVAQIRIAA